MSRWRALRISTLDSAKPMPADSPSHSAALRRKRQAHAGLPQHERRAGQRQEHDQQPYRPGTLAQQQRGEHQRSTAAPGRTAAAPASPRRGSCPARSRGWSSPRSGRSAPAASPAGAARAAAQEHDAGRDQRNCVGASVAIGAAHTGGFEQPDTGYQISPHTNAPVSRPATALALPQRPPLYNSTHTALSNRWPVEPGVCPTPMNPNLARLQPYPFQKLAALLKGVHAEPGALRRSICRSASPSTPRRHSSAQALVDNLDGLAVYPATAGSEALRQAIAGWLERRYRLAALDPAQAGAARSTAAAKRCSRSRRPWSTRSRPARAWSCPIRSTRSTKAPPCWPAPRRSSSTSCRATASASTARSCPSDVGRTQLLYVCSPGQSRPAT